MSTNPSSSPLGPSGLGDCLSDCDYCCVCWQADLADSSSPSIWDSPSTSSLIYPSPSTSPQQHLHYPTQFNTAAHGHISAAVDMSQFSNVPKSYPDLHYSYIPSSASSDCSHSPHMVLTPTHDGFIESAQPKAEWTGNAYDLHSYPPAQSPDWYPDSVESHAYGMAHAHARSWCAEDQHVDYSGPRRNYKLDQASEFPPPIPPSSLFAQQPHHESQHQQRPQLYPLHIPTNTAPIESTHLQQHHLPLTLPAAISPLTGFISQTPSPTRDSGTQPVKLHHPRPSRRIPIISLSELASAEVSLPQCAPYGGLDATGNLTPFSPIDDYYDQLIHEPTQEHSVLLCSCGCMELYTIGPD